MDTQKFNPPAEVIIVKSGRAYGRYRPDSDSWNQIRRTPTGFRWYGPLRNKPAGRTVTWEAFAADTANTEGGAA